MTPSNGSTGTGQQEDGTAALSCPAARAVPGLKAASSVDFQKECLLPQALTFMFSKTSTHLTAVAREVSVRHSN